MTYISKQAKLDSPAAQRKIKLGAIAFAAIAAICAAILMSAPQSKPRPLATQPATLELAGSSVDPQTTFKSSQKLSYHAIDNSIRDVQMETAHLGHSMKLALISDKNPIKRFFVCVERTYSLMGMLVGLAFIFTLVSFGFIRAPKGDLSNY